MANTLSSKGLIEMQGHVGPYIREMQRIAGNGYDYGEIAEIVRSEDSALADTCVAIQNTLDQFEDKCSTFYTLAMQSIQDFADQTQENEIGANTTLTGINDQMGVISAEIDDINF